MKALGSEIMAFYNEWPVGDDWYVDDGYECDEEGNLMLDPNEEYDVSEAIGYLCWQGRGNCPSSIEVHGVRVPIPVSEGWNGPDTAAVFKAWRGDARPYSVMLSADEAEKFKAVCAENGWKLV